MVISTMMLFMALLATVLAASYLLGVVRDGAEDDQIQPQHRWRDNVSRLHNRLMSAIPLSTVRIVVTVLQIVTQVRSVRDGLNPIWVYDVPNDSQVNL